MEKVKSDLIEEQAESRCQKKAKRGGEREREVTAEPMRAIGLARSSKVGMTYRAKIVLRRPIHLLLRRSLFFFSCLKFVTKELNIFYSIHYKMACWFKVGDYGGSSEHGLVWSCYFICGAYSLSTKKYAFGYSRFAH